VTGAAVARYLRRRGVSDPEGLADEVFVRALRTLQTFEGDGERFRSWIFTMAQNAASDDARRRRCRVVEVLVAAPPDRGGDDVEVEVFGRLAHDRVALLLSDFSPEQGEVLSLRVVADLSVEEIASVLGKSYEAVKSLQRRGLINLRRALAAEDAPPPASPRTARRVSRFVE